MPDRPPLTTVAETSASKAPDRSDGSAYPFIPTPSPYILAVQGMKGTALTPASSGTTSATVSTSTVAIAADSTRRDFTISNKHPTATIWLSRGGTAVVGQGIPVYAGQTYIDDRSQAAVSVISDVASTPYAYSQN